MARLPKKTAYVACNGGCRSINCGYGCIACSACINACRKEAVSYNEYGTAEIDVLKCVGCGLCVKACPQKLIQLHDRENFFIVKCSNREKGMQAKMECRISCIACGLCEKNCPSQAVRVLDNIAVLNDYYCLACGNCVISCPRGVIIDTRGIIRR